MRVEVKCQCIIMNDGSVLLHMPCCFCFRFEGREGDLDGAWIWLALLENSELPTAAPTGTCQGFIRYFNSY